MNNIISLDGGGTKTKGIIYSNKGEVLEEIQTGFSNATINYEKTLENITECLNCLFKKDYKVDLLVLGISGTKNEVIRQKLKSDLEKKYIQKIILITDLEMAYYSYFTSHNGILGIIGTGSSFITIKNNKLKLSGGWGHILQDYGSGYKLSIEIIRETIEEYEKGNYELSEKIKSFYRLNDFLDIKNIVYKEDKKEVAKLSREIFNWLIDDKLSKNLKNIIQHIINSEIDKVANQIYNFYKINFAKQENIDIILTGGVVTNNDFYYNCIKEKLKELCGSNVNIKKLKVDPVYGGYNIALRYMKGM
ncbi:BadF/BadG/BcrA/BcrD ATPase family protein [Senegalia massiliensis]|uniref:ATPase BadF/BadG/BcrA/BcrD type domain-containing protein n=1 Tax=Senegalia massiliensis TaxID=1720316 RepID=A0A845QX01_9CLOT|nr:BadF/BadG/BcrA/BcrD ATPase family protein [Senegalia massiliensis]NBI07025.1 hypothetical protein [Senegalia massiliensis]